MAERTCSVDGCGRPYHARGLCGKHYQVHYKRGQLPEVRRKSGPEPRPYAERFWAKVDVGAPDACWEWLGARQSNGYGSFGVGNGKVKRSHRVAYELAVGPIPDGLVIDHLCRNRACANPVHLEAVTQQENNRRGAGFAGAGRNELQTHCPNGHELSPDNVWVGKTGHRRCRTCGRARNREQYLRRTGRGDV